MRKVQTGEHVKSTDSGETGIVLIAEQNVAFVDVAGRVSRYELRDGRYQRDYFQPSDGKLGHDELLLLTD